MEQRELMEKIEQSLEKQNRFALIQCILSAVLVGCCVGLIYVASTLLPDLQLVIQHTENALTDLETITAQLAEADLKAMVSNVDQLVSTSQSGVEEALTKLNRLDLDTLNKAIKDLSAVVEPMAKFFNIFN